MLQISVLHQICSFYFKVVPFSETLFRSDYLFVSLFGFYGISNFEGYLMPNPFLYK